MTTRLNITLPDAVAERLRSASSNRPSEYIERAVMRQLLADDLRILAEFEKDNPPDPSFYTENDALAEEIMFEQDTE
ncbi:hypothetical protein OHB26_31615 [Nocardia sp. NBC_01503]|uniref:hypothetical protein n=1 Tax=Nocardia sp. NBC_01503 TaxID=2975997 RepID=UPI002E7B5505|nr:hypothetical protein [Nocardia sp. NBC_01503]WTL31419.1 hypothetical protein OHB26_31615 [Nocardia sp. NBC_01503]